MLAYINSWIESFQAFRASDLVSINVPKTFSSRGP